MTHYHAERINDKPNSYCEQLIDVFIFINDIEFEAECYHVVFDDGEIEINSLYLKDHNEDRYAANYLIKMMEEDLIDQIMESDQYRYG